jgi:hypothetical protein
MIIRYQVVTVASVKTTAVWDIGLCSLTEVGRRFRGVYCLHDRDDEAERTCETSVHF